MHTWTDDYFPGFIIVDYDVGYWHKAIQLVMHVHPSPSTTFSIPGTSSQHPPLSQLDIWYIASACATSTITSTSKFQWPQPWNWPA